MSNLMICILSIVASESVKHPALRSHPLYERGQGTYRRHVGSNFTDVQCTPLHNNHRRILKYMVGHGDKGRSGMEARPYIPIADTTSDLRATTQGRPYICAMTSVKLNLRDGQARPLHQRRTIFRRALPFL